MANEVYNGFLQYVVAGVIDLSSDTIKVALCSSSYTPNVDTHDDYGDLSNEVSGTGYTTGGAALANKTVTHNDTDNVGIFDADDLKWTTVTLTNIKWAVLYKDAVAEADKKLIAAIDLGAAQSPTGVDFQITWNADGILRFKKAA